MSWSHISNLIFPANGRNYAFGAAVYSSDAIDMTSVAEAGKFNDLFDFELDILFVKLFEYSSLLNLLMLNGKLVYEDETGICSSVLNDPYKKLAVLVYEYDMLKTDGASETKNIRAKFALAFIINKARVITRNITSIEYEFDLVSTNFLNLLSGVKYSNHNNPTGDDVFFILKECFNKCKIEYDKTTFNAVTSKTSLKYATSAQDTMLTVFRYLFNKLYFYANSLDDSIKYLYYDEIEKNIKVFDLKNESTYGNHRACVIDIGINGVAEAYQLAEPVKISTVNAKTTTDMYNDMLLLKRFSYSYDSNVIGGNNITNKDITNYVNAFPDSTRNKEKGKFTPFNSGQLDYSIQDSEWNSSRELYHNLSFAAIGHNSPVLVLAGSVGFKPACCIDLMFPINIKDYLDNQEKEKLYLIYKKLYSDMNGVWRVAKVHHIMKPATHEYVLKVTIFRNTRNI